MISPSAGDLVFAVADLHGRYDLLGAAIDAIGTYPTPPGLSRDVVFLGDYVDRGPRSADVITRLMGGPPPGQRWTCLKGNHEAMMSLALRHADKLDWWLDNGGDTTIESYGALHDVSDRHLAWIDALPLIAVRDRHVFVHAGLDRGRPLDEQEEMTLLWKRYRDGDGEAFEGHHVVHGHDPNIDGPMMFPGRTALDTLAWRTGRLVVGIFDAAAGGGPVDLLEVRPHPAFAQFV